MRFIAQFHSVRSSTHLISTSLKVVSMAHVFWASFKRAAIFRRMRFILTRCSDLVPRICRDPSAGGTFTWATAGLSAATGAGGGGRGAAFGGGGGGGFGAPAAGGGGAGLGAAAGAGAAFGAAGAGAAAGAAALAGAAPGLILNRAWPGLTVSPSFTRMSVRVPEKGAGTATVVLSVSISMTASSAANESPTLQVNLLQELIVNR